MFLAQCTRPRFVPDGYIIISAQVFAVVKYTQAHPEGTIIYHLDNAGNYMITAVAYDPERKLIAIAEQNKEPQRGTAVIKIFDEKTSSVVNEIVTKKDRIYGMAIDREGRMVFATGDIFLDNPGELCYLSRDDGIVQTIAKGAHFFSPAWSKDSKRVYFGYSFSYKQSPSDHIGYVEVAIPHIIRQIAEGRSVSVSESGKVAYLTNDGNILIQKTDDISVSSKQLLKHVDPKFTENIRFVKGSEDMVLQHYRKGNLYDLILLQVPYKVEKVMLPYVGMQDFDIAYVKEKNL